MFTPLLSATTEDTPCRPAPLPRAAHAPPARGDADGGLAQAGRRAARGMSLLEIMVVITLIGLVTAAVGVSVMGTLDDGQKKLARDQAFQLEKAVNGYRLKTGRLPSAAEGLTALTQPARGAPVVDRLPTDPWGHGFEYIRPGAKNPSTFDIVSPGPDGQMGTDDDIGNWPEGA